MKAGKGQDCSVIVTVISPCRLSVTSARPPICPNGMRFEGCRRYARDRGAEGGGQRVVRVGGGGGGVS